MATAVGSSAEAEALKLAFSYLVNSVDVAALFPAALSAHLISDPQRSECISEPDPYKRQKSFTVKQPAVGRFAFRGVRIAHNRAIQVSTRRQSLI